MQVFMQPLENLKEFEEITQKLPKNEGILQLSGCVETQKAHIMYGLFEAMKKKTGQEKANCLIIAENDLKAKELYEDYRLYNREVMFYPAKDLIFFEADVHGNLLTKERMKVLAALLEKKGVTVITSMGGCMDYLLPLETIEKHVLHFQSDSPLDMDKLKKQLLGMGYEKNAQAEAPGQFSFRGGIIDIFPLTEDNPVRIELWGDEIDSIRSFDAESQRSIENLDEITIYPAAEMLLSDEVLKKGIKKIQKDRDAAVQKFRDAFLTEEAGRLKQVVTETLENLTEFHDFSAAEHFLRYFYKDVVTFTDYFDTEKYVDTVGRNQSFAGAGTGCGNRISGKYGAQAGKGLSVGGADGFVNQRQTDTAEDKQEKLCFSLYHRAAQRRLGYYGAVLYYG